MRRLLISIVLMGLLLPAGCAPPEEKKVVQKKPRPVRIRPLVSRDMPYIARAVGRLVPDREVVISAQVTGIVKQVNADAGTRAGLGMVLVKLDDTDYKLALNESDANLRSAQARLSAAERRYARAERLLPDKAITPQAYDAAEAEYLVTKGQVAQLKAVVAIARQRLSKTVITAPFDGYVTQKLVELGQNVGVGAPVMGIADMRVMRVRIHMNEHDYMLLDKDDPVTVVVEAYSDQPFQGRVDKIGIKADARTNTFEVDILLDNTQFLFKAGLTARVAVQTESIPDAVVIPQNSVLFREDRKEVFIVESGDTAAVRVVRLGRVTGSEVRVLEGLSAGDKLVVSGAQYLKTGDKVAVIP